MIPKIKYNLIADLIEHNPVLFKNTAMVGIYDGQDICSCFLNKASCLETLQFYENFQDSESEDSKNRLLNLYNSWKNEIPNFMFEIGNGTELSSKKEFDFFFTDAYDIDYRSYFNDKKFNNTLIAICGFGAELTRTVDLSVSIYNKNIYPVMLYNGFLFFCNTDSKYKKVHRQFKQFFDNLSISYVNRMGCLRPNGWYHSLLVKQEAVYD